MSKKKIIFTAVSMALCMSICMAFVMTLVNLGFSPQFLQVWFEGITIGFVVSLSLVFVVPPLIDKIAAKLGL